jgi:hypothetical protein
VRLIIAPSKLLVLCHLRFNLVKLCLANNGRHTDDFYPLFRRVAIIADLRLADRLERRPSLERRARMLTISVYPAGIDRIAQQSCGHS